MSKSIDPLDPEIDFDHKTSAAAARQQRAANAAASAFASRSTVSSTQASTQAQQSNSYPPHYRYPGQPHSQMPIWPSQVPYPPNLHPSQIIPQGYPMTPHAALPPEHPSNWTEHLGPNGLAYFYNSVTGKSTWERPDGFDRAPAYPGASAPQQPNLNSISEEFSTPALPHPTETAKAQRDEHPIALKKLPNSAWAIVITSKDNEFFINIQTRVVTWGMPDEIGELVGQILADPGGFVEELEEEEEDEGIEDPNATVIMSNNKRKMEEGSAAEHDPSKRLKTPAELSVEEKHALFQALLREADVNPFSPCEKELSKIAQDWRYLLLPTLKERKHQFEVFCRVRATELRELSAKQKETTIATASGNRIIASDPKSQFMSLLEEDSLVTMNTSTTSGYDDFARRWRKKDERFTAIRDDRDRKAYFKEHIANLKEKQMEKRREEKKRVASEFFELLREERVLVGALWKDVRPRIDHDKRFLEVKSMIEREELFREYMKRLATAEAKSEEERKELERKAREEESLRLREDAVRKHKRELEKESHGKRNKLFREEAVATFQTILVDHIRSHDAKFDDFMNVISGDRRWEEVKKSLPPEEASKIFAAHVGRLYENRLAAFHKAISEIAFSPIIPFDDIRDDLLLDSRTAKLDRSVADIARLYDECQNDRKQRMRQDVWDAVRENAFVSFSVKNAVQKVAVQAVEEGKVSGSGVSESKIEEGAEFKLVDLNEIHMVLLRDKRYLDFEFDGQERERIVFSHVKSLIEQYRAEKGGVLDRIVAKNAGALKQ